MGVMAATEAGLGNSIRIYLRSKSCRGFTMALSKASKFFTSLGSQCELGKKSPSRSVTVVGRGIIKARMFCLIVIVFVIVTDLDRQRSFIVSHHLIHRQGGGFFCRLANRRCGSLTIRLSCSAVRRVWTKSLVKAQK